MLKRLVNNLLSDSKVGFQFNIVIQVLIVISLITFSIETVPGLSERTRKILDNIETVIVLVFSLEYLMRLWNSKPSTKFIFSFFGLIDLMAILPFYLALGVDFTSIRALRLLRLFRILKLARYSKAIDHFRRALILSKGQLVVSLFGMLILLYLAAVGIYYFENRAQPEQFRSVFDSLWWSIATLTTVGYGDLYPITVGGKIFTFFVLIVGLGIVALPAGIFAAALTKTHRKN